MASRVTALLYHDVLEGEDPDQSGLPGKNSAEYKIASNEFDRHLTAINKSLRSPVITRISEADSSVVPPVMFTFDDGGVSAIDIIAPALERNGWKGVFFIPTDYIDKDAFLSRDQIRALYNRGHIIGSHSCSHPKKISECTPEQLLSEWCGSLKILSEILERPVTVASIPGGFYSNAVVEAAIECGVKYLFTSEPVQKVWHEGECAIIGRFSVKRGDEARVPAEFAANNPLRMFRQYSYWNIKKAAKAFSGPVYPWVRSYYLSRKNG
ncbi:MAG: polysaccharide deacetylase family protein [Methylococcaceae bacterium]